MALTTSSSSVTYVSGTSLPVAFKFFDNADLVLTRGGAAMTEGVDYTLAGAGDDAGGTVTLLTGAATSDAPVMVARLVELTQPTAFHTFGTFAPAIHENALDRAAMAAQQIQRELDEEEATRAADDATETAARAAAVTGEAAARAAGDAAEAVARAAGDASVLTAFNVLRADIGGDTVARQFSVMDFGAKGDGITDDTAAFAAAFAALTAGQTLHVPAGIYMVQAAVGQGLVMPEGITVRGDGYDSVLRVIATSIVSSVGHSVLCPLSNTALRDIRLDGNRAAIDRTGLGAGCSLNFVYMKTGTVSAGDGFIAENVWIHDLIGVSTEAFGLMTAGGCTNVQFRHCKAWDIEGTAFHFDGDINVASGGGSGNWYDDVPGTSALFDGGLLLECEAQGCSWQGVSVYGAKNVRIVGGRFNDNGLNGVNVEWAQNVEVLGVEASGNQRGGLGTYGRANVRARGCNFHDNNVAGSYGEVSIASGVWFTGSPKPKAWAEVVEIINCRLAPTSTGRHVHYGRDSSCNIGNFYPDRILCEGGDVHTWLIGDNHSDPFKYACLELRGFELFGAAGAGGNMAGSAWTPSGAMTRAAYAGAGAVGPHPVALTASTQFAHIEGRNCLQPGHTYRVRIRAKSEDATEWSVIAQMGADASKQLSIAIFSPSSGALNQWISHDAVVRIPSAYTDNCRVQVMRTAATGSASTLDVDYLSTEEVASPSVAHPEAIGWLSRVVGQGTAAPSSGTWAVGDIVLNNAPATNASANMLGWVCITAGTPGTWRESGKISFDLDQPTFGDATTLGRVTVDGPAATSREFDISTGGMGRWNIRALNDAESGPPNAGSTFEIAARADDGTFLWSALRIDRATGVGDWQKGLKVGSGAATKKHLSGTYAGWAPSTISNGASAIRNVTVTGAAVGDPVAVGITPALPDGCVISGSVHSTDTVTVCVGNLSGGDVTLSSSTLRASVWQY